MTELAGQLSAALAGRYRLERELRRGGMATVFLAEDLKHRCPVAIKVFDPELAVLLGPERFLREIEIAARLQHPHILNLLDSGEAQGLLYYVMPYVEGESLRERLERERQLPVDEALRLTREVADALDFAHRAGVVHRDIKPENILLQAGHAVVADFGIARAVTAAGGPKLTTTGTAMGTPAYMSPEQVMGSRDLDGRSDLYSLGCVLYEMLAGVPPFAGATAESMAHQHLSVTPPPVTSVRPGVPKAMARAIAKCLAKTPADRFGTAAEFAQALATEKSITATRPVARIALGVAAAVAVLAVGALLVRRLTLQRPAGPVHKRTAIAVLPFENLSADQAHAYFAGGLHDELLTQLSKVASLKVISRTSVMGYAGTKTPLRRIADELGVGSVVEGSVQVVGGRLRVNVQLIDAATDEHRWAERYDRTLDDAFAIQSEVAQQIVVAVGGALGTAESAVIVKAPTANAEAYRLYLQAREYHLRPGRLMEDYESARSLYERALSLDPGFALAHAELSLLHGIVFGYRYDPTPERLASERREAEMALRLAPDLPEAHMALGRVHYYGQADYVRALSEFDIALRSLPNDAQLWNMIGSAQRRLGKWREAEEAYKQATRLDPRAADLIRDLGGSTFLVTRRYAEAQEACDRALALAPDLHTAAIQRGWVLALWQGNLDTLRAVLDRLPPDVPLGTYGTTRAQRAGLLLWERQPGKLLALLASSPTRVFDSQRFYTPTTLYAGWAHQLTGGQAAARAAFESSLGFLDSAMVEFHDDWRVHAARGLALAGLDRRAAALEEARWLEQSPIYRKDAIAGPWVSEHRARILSQAGESTAALREIERLLSRPSLVSVHTLRLDPLLDPLRRDSRFQRLLAGP